MDLNHLLSRHQIALMLADRATNATSRHSHRRTAGHYAGRVRVLQIGSSATAAPLMVA